MRYRSGMTTTPPAPACASTVRLLSADDVAGVRTLLNDLPVDYPGGDGWLRKRLADVTAGNAHCLVTGEVGSPTGVVILTPKSNALKLSTIYVAPDARSRGLGRVLMQSVMSKAMDLNFREVYVTVAEHKVYLLQGLLNDFGFTFLSLERDRYGNGRHEAVFTSIRSA